MAQKTTNQGFTIGDGFRLGIGFALANAAIGLLCAIAWFTVVAGLLGVAAVHK